MAHSKGLKLSDFVGRWSLDRQIVDNQTLGENLLQGTADFAWQGNALIYDECGTLIMPGQPPMKTTRRYIWREDKDEIHVSFADERPFHHFALSGANADASHFCAPDMYKVTYDFSHWPEWHAIWKVNGPKKDYEMISSYRRI